MFSETQRDVSRSCSCNAMWGILKERCRVDPPVARTPAAGPCQFDSSIRDPADPSTSNATPSLVSMVTSEALRTAEQRSTLAAYYRTITPLLQPLRERLEQLQAQLARQ